MFRVSGVIIRLIGRIGRISRISNDSGCQVNVAAGEWSENEFFREISSIT